MALGFLGDLILAFSNYPRFGFRALVEAGLPYCSIHIRIFDFGFQPWPLVIKFPAASA